MSESEVSSNHLYTPLLSFERQIYRKRETQRVALCTGPFMKDPQWPELSLSKAGARNLFWAFHMAGRAQGPQISSAILPGHK